MSLSLEGFMKVMEEGGKIDKRLNKLIGFNPTTCNHYGMRYMYNIRISENTSDEQILKIRSDYLNWKRDILVAFENNGFLPDDERFNELFSVDGMYGTVRFLGIPVDIYSGIDPYRLAISEYIKCAKL